MLQPLPKVYLQHADLRVTQERCGMKVREGRLANLLIALLRLW